MKILKTHFFLVILSANEFLNFGWWWHVHGSFNIADIGNFLVWLGLFVIFFKRKVKDLSKTLMTPLCFFYIIFCLIQVTLGALNYNQSLGTGIIGVRHQFYFASFFYFYLAFDDLLTIRKILNCLTIIAIIAAIIGIINYFGLNILTHKWASGHGMRSGIVRPFIPGMPVISFALIWEFSKFICSRNNKKMKTGSISFFLLAIHIFRQTRMRIIGLLFVVVGTLFFKRKFIELISLLSLALVVVVIVELTMKENIVTDPVISAYNDTMESSGASWRARLRQVEVAANEIKKHPIIGSGAISLRPIEDSYRYKNTSNITDIAYMSDWGYLHWMKAYGIVGTVWLFLFFSHLYRKSSKATKKYKSSNDQDVALFCLLASIFIIATFVTLNHLMFPASIPLVCLLAAIVSRINNNIVPRQDHLI